ncbi:MAG: ComEC/Rec2 family competence protein [Myxococcota bacterium]
MDVLTGFGIAVLVGLALAPDLAPSPLVGAALVGVLLLGSRWRRVLLIPTGLVLGGLMGVSLPEGPVLRGPVAIQGRVATAPMGRVADVAVDACAEAGRPFAPCRGRVRVVFPASPRLGSTWVVQGDGAAPTRSGPGGAPDRARAARLSRVRTVLRARSAVPLGAPPEDRPVLEGPASVLAAVAQGDRRGVDEETWAILRDTGTSHLLAISGFHVGVVAGGVGGLVTLGIRRLGWVRPEGVSTAWAWWAGALAAGTYAWLAGAPISAQRAAGVVVLGAVGRSLGRTLEPYRLLAMAAVGVCLVDPGAIATPGFQLSFGAVFGLLRFGPALDPWARLLPRGLGWMGTGLVATFAATLGTLPAAAWWFQSLSVSSPVANLFAVPYMAFVVVPFAATATWAPDPLAGWGLWGGELAVRFMLAVLSQLRTAPLAPAVGPFGALVLCGVFVRVRWGWILTVLVLGLGLRTRSAGGLEVTFFDVGQGDAALVEFPDGRRWLVDGGRTPAVRDALRRRGVRHLDVVIASHADADHAAGLLPVVTDLRVDALWIGRYAGHEELLEAAHARGVEVRVLRPAVVDGSDNDASLVVTAHSPWGSVLFAGDVEAAGEAVLHAPATVLKVPHHGSDTSSSEAFLDRVRPVLAVASVGYNRYGHPSRAVVDRYVARDIPLLRTDLDGTITVRLDPNGLSAYSDAGVRVADTRRATTPNTTTAMAAITMLNPWL